MYIETYFSHHHHSHYNHHYHHHYHHRNTFSSYIKNTYFILLAFIKCMANTLNIDYRASLSLIFIRVKITCSHFKVNLIIANTFLVKFKNKRLFLCKIITNMATTIWNSYWHMCHWLQPPSWGLITELIISTFWKSVTSSKPIIFSKPLQQHTFHIIRINNIINNINNILCTLPNHT